MKIVLDIDGVVCNNTNGQYQKAKPYEKMIGMVNKLYDEGHTIIFNSARGYGRFKGDMNKIYDSWYEFTLNQLKKWGLKFDQLYLGKVEGDLYVDDKALRVKDDGSEAEKLCKFIRGE